MTESPVRVSNVDDAEIRVEHLEILSVRRGHLLRRSSSADDDMRVHDVWGAARCEKLSDACRVDPAKRDDVTGRLPDKAGKAHLAGGRPDHLSERRRRDRDAGSGLAGPGKQHKDAAVGAFESNQGAGVQGHPRHQAAVLAVDG